MTSPDSSAVNDKDPESQLAERPARESNSAQAGLSYFNLIPF